MKNKILYYINPNSIIGKTYNRLKILKFIKKKSRLNGYDYLYKCKCKCGKITIVSYHSLKRNHTKSCGCLKNETYKKIRNHYGENSFNGIYWAYKCRAKKKKLPFYLSKNLFKKLTKENCFYCNSKPKSRFKAKYAYGYYTYNGVDRINNKKGYTIENSVPCCKTCNYAKKSMSITKFKSWIKKVYQHLIK